MNLTISKEQILVGLQAVQNVVSTRTTLPILSNVLLRAEGSHVEITATDLDVTVACKVEAKVTKAGATTLPVKKLFGIVRELNGEIEIETDEKNVASIRSGTRHFRNAVPEVERLNNIVHFAAHLLFKGGDVIGVVCVPDGQRRPAVCLVWNGVVFPKLLSRRCLVIV